MQTLERVRYYGWMFLIGVLLTFLLLWRAFEQDERPWRR